jgi:cation diffusion facilitator family transporter
MITALIGAVLAFVAIGLGYRALATLQVEPDVTPGSIALIAALVSFASKEILYRYSAQVGRRIKSPAVIANAWHHRSDSLSSIPAAIAVAGAMFLPGWYFLDRIGAVLVSIFILQAAWKIAWPAVKELMDWGAEPEIRERIQQISADTEGVLHVHKCRTRRLGFGFQVDLHVQVRPDLTVEEGHDISEAVKRRLLDEGPNIVDVITHLEPYKAKNGPSE